MAGQRAFRVDTPEASQAMVMAVLQGEAGPASDIVALNAGAALCVAGRAASVKDGLIQAQRLIAEGAALAKLEQWRAFCNAQSPTT
jgi:anthranilate phosphoribosyltransferase